MEYAKKTPKKSKQAKVGKLKLLETQEEDEEGTGNGNILFYLFLDCLGRWERHFNCLAFSVTQ